MHQEMRDKALEDILLASIKEQRRARRWGIFFKLAFLAYLLVLLFPLWGKGTKHTPAVTSHVGVVDILGEIDRKGPSSSDGIIQALEEAYAAKGVKGILLNINSPGGLPTQSHYVVEELRRQKEKHPDIPVYAVIADMGASAAYHIASAADEIYVDPMSLVGSIGVLAPGFGAVELMKTLGVESRMIAAGDHKMMLDPFQEIDPREKKMVQTMVDTAHQVFINDVKQGRGERLKDDKDLFSGRYWTGGQAVELGLADGYGSLASVAREQLELEELVYYTSPKSWLDNLSGRFGAQMANSFASALDNRAALKGLSS